MLGAGYPTRATRYSPPFVPRGKVRASLLTRLLAPPRTLPNLLRPSPTLCHRLRHLRHPRQPGAFCAGAPQPRGPECLARRVRVRLAPTWRLAAAPDEQGARTSARRLLRMQAGWLGGQLWRRLHRPAVGEVGRRIACGREAAGASALHPVRRAARRPERRRQRAEAAADRVRPSSQPALPRPRLPPPSPTLLRSSRRSDSCDAKQEVGGD